MSDLMNTLLDDGIDPRYAAAGDVLVKIAADENVDLDELSDDEIGGMLTDIVEGDSTGDGEDFQDDGGYEGGEGGEGGDEGTKESSVITHAVIGRELSKIAAAEGVNLSSLSQGDYNDVYNDLANAMVQPNYFTKQAAAQEKLAEADAIGRAMAHSFDDELHNLAGSEKIALSMGGAGHYAREGARKAMGQPKRMAAAVRRGASKVRGAESRGAERLGKRIGNIGRGEKGEAGRAGKTVMAIAKRLKGGTSSERMAKARRIAGRGAVGAAAGAAGGATAAGAHYAFDEDVTNAARSILMDSGIDPDTGEKLAYDDQVMAQAVALLEEKGYSLE